MHEPNHKIAGDREYCILKESDEDYLFVFNGPNGEEMSVPFQEIWYDNRTITLKNTRGIRRIAIPEFQMERGFEREGVTEWMIENGREVERV